VIADGDPGRDPRRLAGEAELRALLSLIGPGTPGADRAL
jgi:hypothetical protein